MRFIKEWAGALSLVLMIIGFVYFLYDRAHNDGAKEATHNANIKEINKSISTINTKQASLENKINNLNDRLSYISGVLAQLNKGNITSQQAETAVNAILRTENSHQAKAQLSKDANISPDQINAIFEPTLNPVVTPNDMPDM